MSISNSEVIEQEQENNQKIIKMMLDKSIESFLLAIEIYNKPTIKYRVEGFVMLICNAWELLLKAKLLSDDVDIYFKGNKNKTIRLQDALEKVIPSTTDYIRLNLQYIAGLRNSATHFIVEETEIIYGPLFQACVINYINKAKAFFNVDVCSSMTLPFITITNRLSDLDHARLVSKYGKEIADALINQASSIDKYDDQKFAIYVNLKLYTTKKASNADFTVYNSTLDDAELPVTYLHVVKPLSTMYPYTFKDLEREFKKHNIQSFSAKTLKNYCLKNNIYDNQKYYFLFQDKSYKSKKYSQAFVEKVLLEVANDPDLFTKIK